MHHFLLAIQLYALIHPVPFKDKSTGNNLQYVWDFGDGSQSTTQDPYHKYKQSGTYWPSLTITDDIGCKDGIISAYDCFRSCSEISA